MRHARKAALVAGAALALATAVPILASPSQGRAQNTSTTAPPSQAQIADAVNKINALNWQGAPGSGTIAGKATITISDGTKFLAPPDSSTYVQIQRNPPADNIYILTTADNRWFSVFQFDPSGYVKDDEHIDPDALLKTLKKENQENIEERRRLNLPIMTLTDWYVTPHYDKQTHRLEWGTKLLDEDGTVEVNYTVRLLGRTGVMHAMLVSDPQSFHRDLSDFKSQLNTFSFNSGENYSEFKPGDKVAAYGLGALIVGGATAVAVKSGAGFLKFIWVGIVGIAAAIGSFFKRLFGKKP